MKAKKITMRKWSIKEECQKTRWNIDRTFTQETMNWETNLLTNMVNAVLFDN
jgi:hypothetical protein